jgi:hypothetical protein
MAGNVARAASQRRTIEQRISAMLSEKFFLFLESLIRNQGQVHADGSPRVVSSSPHVPVKLPQQQR